MSLPISLQPDMWTIIREIKQRSSLLHLSSMNVRVCHWYWRDLDDHTILGLCYDIEGCHGISSLLLCVCNIFFSPGVTVKLIAHHTVSCFTIGFDSCVVLLYVIVQDTMKDVWIG